MENAKFWQEFFQLYKDLPALWRIKSTEYTDRVLKSNCYLKLIEKLKEIHPDADREMVVRKINNYRTSYRKELKRLRKSKQAGKIYKPTLWYFDCLRFLDDQDEDGGEKYTYEDEHTEETKQTRQDVTNTITCKKLATKRYGHFKDKDEQLLPNTSKRKKVIHHYHKKPARIKVSHEEQQQAKIDADILAKSWAIQYNELLGKQKLIARKLISDILFYGCMGTLDMNHIIELQGIFQKESKDFSQRLNLQAQSPIGSNSSFSFAEQEVFNTYTSGGGSPTELNTSSPVISKSPAMNFITEFNATDIKLEEP